ncbi:unnamed protein product [Peronospora belbahrii]|uniref:Snapin/Pallidin/Snn1 n=1 Tax=Peronospora belbahrii TaxID=622444 RepID=A0AAU9L825_9STRA|nr:unnamed protein product [Peronospora belbahrii]
MAATYGGRVLPGEDSEESDDENDNEMNYSLNGFEPQSSVAVSRFTAPTFGASSSKECSTEDKKTRHKDEEENEELELKYRKEKIKSVQKEVIGEVEEEEKEEEEEEEEDVARDIKQAMKRDVESFETKQDHWHLNESLNGVEVMSNAFVDTVQPSLDATIHRITELKESQQRLLKMLTEQNTSIRSNKQVEDAAVVLEKLPFYAKKLEGIKLAMQEISNSTEKMKCRAEDLRIDAQSHAIKKENKRDALSQWNKLYAAKSS